MQDILKGLNDKQYEAVVNTEGPCLVIAGAGSGKTKVLTHKIAYLIGEKQVKPWNILAITFTNKAANEMKERIELLVGDKAKDMWVGTFHSICVRILRKFIDRIGFDSSFIIIFITYLGNYQEPPPPPPEPPPDEPPPESDEPPSLLDGLEDIAVVAVAIVVVINVLKLFILKSSLESYQSGAFKAIVSNCSIHTFDTSKAYVYGNIL